jgi:U3 small nucleolar RNA-associated protein 4
MSSYSKEHMLHSPLSISLLKDPIRGAITDNSDSKRILMFTKYLNNVY